MLKKLATLRIKFAIITFFTYLLLVGVTLIACYLRFSGNMISSYEQHGYEILNLASDDIIIDHIPDYLSGDYDTAEYDRTRRKLDLYPEFFEEVFYLYAYYPHEDGLNATYIFDAEVNHDDAYKLGDNYVLEHDVVDQLKRHGIGQPMDTLTDNTEWGYLLTCSKPLVDSNGVFQGYLLVDFDLTKARQENQWFILRLFGLIMVLMLIVFSLGVHTVNVRITEPIEKIYHCLSKFRYSSHKDREENLKRLRELDIHTNPEIQSLYEALLTSADASLRYINEYRNVTEKLGAAKEKAYTDVLTGLRNKAAFEDKVSELLGRIDSSGSPEIAVIMADLNNLKYINDTFGHKYGDEFIIGSCKVMTTFCQNSEIFRMGGDEFLIVLEGEDYANRQLLLQMMKSHFIDTYTDESREPWKRYSVSLGLAQYESTDTGLAEMMKRADEAMYEEKSAFKEKYGSYR